jgi:hypothetical protein
MRLLYKSLPDILRLQRETYVKTAKHVTAARREEGMQANPNKDRLSGTAVRPSATFEKLPEYAYRAAILAVMMLLLWTVA